MILREDVSLKTRLNVHVLCRVAALNVQVKGCIKNDQKDVNLSA